MAYAIITNFDHVETDGTNAQLCYGVVYGGADVGRIDVSWICIPFVPGDSPTNIRSKLSTAVLNQAKGYGYSLTAPDVTMPTFQKGV